MHEAIKSVLLMPMRHSNNKVIYIPMGVDKNQKEVLKLQAVFER